MSLWFRSDWVNPLGRYNWLDFTLVQVTGEYDRRFGSVEFHIALMGLHVGGTWKVAEGDAEFQSELQEMLDGWEAK